MAALSLEILRVEMILSEAAEPDTKASWVCRDRLLCIVNALCRWPMGRGVKVEQRLLSCDPILSDL